MNKTDFVNAVAEKASMSKKDAEKALNAVIDVVKDALVAGEKVQLVGFGSFEVRERAARTGHNPRTKEVIQIPASRLPVFRPGKALRNAVDGK
jgi:DNA-binding protein HU-beta